MSEALNDPEKSNCFSSAECRPENCCCQMNKTFLCMAETTCKNQNGKCIPRSQNIQGYFATKENMTGKEKFEYDICSECNEQMADIQGASTHNYHAIDHTLFEPTALMAAYRKYTAHKNKICSSKVGPQDQCHHNCQCPEGYNCEFYIGGGVGTNICLSKDQNLMHKEAYEMDDDDLESRTQCPLSASCNCTYISSGHLWLECMTQDECKQKNGICQVKL